MNLHGKRVLLAGAGTGIGRTSALLLSSRGVKLVAVWAVRRAALRAELPGTFVVTGDVPDGAART